MSTSARRADRGDGLFIVGLVGRTGSGKSTLARLLAHGGAPIIEADALGHEITDTDPRVRQALIAEYGPGVYGTDGKLNRGQVAARVFSDPAARARLDALVHPGIVARIGGRLDELRAQGYHGLVFLDAALLLEWGLEHSCDAVVAVSASEQDQIKRLHSARGWDEAEARRRLAAQRSNEEFAAAADITIRNAGDSGTSLEELARDTAAELESMLAFNDRPARRKSETETC